MAKRTIRLCQGVCGAALLMLTGCAIDHETANPEVAIRPAHDTAVAHEGEAATHAAWTPNSDRLGAPHAVADIGGPYLLDSGDKLRIFVYGQPNLSRSYSVDHAGLITVPLIGEVRARGLTTGALERTIKARLGTQFVRDPQVTVDMLQNRPFFILGEVKTAGQYPYVSGMTVETAVAIAGGYSDRASTQRFRISRRINGITELIEAPSDTVVQPGDTVTVFERYF